MSPVGKNVETEVQARAQPIGQSLEEVASHQESYLTAARQKLAPHLASLSVPSCGVCETPRVLGTYFDGTSARLCS